MSGDHCGFDQDPYRRSSLVDSLELSRSMGLRSNAALVMLLFCIFSSPAFAGDTVPQSDNISGNSRTIPRGTKFPVALETGINESVALTTS
jgi:hypothetical protein